MRGTLVVVLVVVGVGGGGGGGGAGGGGAAGEEEEEKKEQLWSTKQSCRHKRFLYTRNSVPVVFEQHRLKTKSQVD